MDEIIPVSMEIIRTAGTVPKKLYGPIEPKDGPTVSVRANLQPFGNQPVHCSPARTYCVERGAA
jgi:hypothetical protein